jgi:N-acetylglucosaminyldiphosphoundecaprenol N-acetyl-beta-D-mannosaminyltransferase
MAKILGINISEINKQELLKKLKNYLKEDKKRLIVTPNPEIILKAHQDEELFYILNQANISLADGFGLQLAGFLSKQSFPRITGADISLDLLSLSEEGNKKVAIINRHQGKSSNQEITMALKKNWPKLSFIVLNQSADNKMTDHLKNNLEKFSPDILFCLFGSPWQEKFIYHNYKEIKNLKLAIGVGGAFDFLTKKSIRAPLFLRKIGLEWLWRLIIQPKRWSRIFKATFIFILKIIKWRFVLPHCYRKNVACLLYRKNRGKREILIVKRSDQTNHWQLPQGGLDGQTIIDAGKRELREELGTSKFTVEGIYKNLYKYKFEDRYSSKEEKNKHYDVYGYKGQKQNLIIARFTGRPEDIKINFWDHQNWRFVEETDLIKSVHPVRQKAAKIYLKKFKQLKHEKN